MIRFFLISIILISFFDTYSQSYIHYIGPVHSKQNVSLAAREQMLYVTSPNTSGNVYVKITSHDKVDLFNMPPGGEIKYFIGNDENSKLVINSDGLGRNLDNKGFIVEGFSDELYTIPTSIFVETRVQVGNVNGNQRMQSNSSFIKGDLAPGKNFRLGHGVFDRMDEYRRAFVTFMAIEEGTTQVTVSDLKEGWEPFYNDFGLGDLDFEIIDGDYVFTFDQNQSHAIALNIDQDDPIENKDALIGALVSSDKDIVINVGYWGGANSWAGFGRDVGYDQIKPTNHISNEYIFLSAAGQHAVGGDITSSLEYAIIVAHEDSSKIWIDTPISDTSSVSPNYTINKGDYKVLYFQNSEDNMYVISNKRVYGYQNMAGNDDGPQDAAMMLISGINPLASNKIDGIYNIQDIAGVNFDMKLKILTKTDADLNLNDIPHTAFSFDSGVIEGKEEFSFYEFSEADVNTIISTKPSKRLIIESDGPVYGMYYGYNSPQGVAGYFFSFSDFDNDGISDSDDLDDDNDGILDVWELDEDTDSDGLINRYDLDSDGDGCYDVVEAGYTDQDDNGILGYGETDEVIVDDLGKVIKNDDLSDVVDGYTLPNDLDVNSIPDFRQFGFQLEIVKHPEDIVIVESCPDYIENPPFFEVETNGVYVSYLWQVSEDSGNTWTRIFDTESYDGITDQKLKIINSNLDLSSNLYRAILSTKGYLCGVNDTSNVAKVTVLPDNDKDCIADIDDLDDDNDGILDTIEDSLDNDSDGIPNYFDLDSDGDGCFDVIEAGFLDSDSDGYLGNSPVSVDTLGKVISSSEGYKTPADLDFNSIYDFLDYGSEPKIITQPVSKMTSNVGEVYFFVSATSDSKLNYQWEVSSDFGSSWIKINNDSIYDGANKDTLKINNLSFDMDSYRYRVIISVPSFVCAEDVISNWVFLMVRPDNDRDGIFDDMDVDDDNDGIYDSIELSCESNRFIEDFGQGDYTSTPYTNYDYAAEGVVSDGSYTIASNTTNWFNNWLEFSDHTGNPNGRMFICNAQYDPGKYFYKRRIDGLNLNVPYEVSFWLKDIIRMYHVNTGNLNTHIPPNITFEVYAITDNEQGDLLYKYNTGNVPRDEKWHEYRFNFNNLENPSIEIVLSSEQPGGYGNDFALDDIEFNSGCYEDIDADGIINSFDLDTDGDGCLDVLEAGFDDFDMDSLLGNSPFIVDIWGRVVGENGGYLMPYDNDSSGVYDFKEYGISSIFITHPQSDSLVEYDTSFLHVNYSPPSSLVKWQISYDSGISWVNIDSLENFSGQDTDTLHIYNLSLDMDQYRFRAYVFNTAFVCGDTIFSETSTVSVLPDNDKDGIADMYDLDDDNDGIYDTDEGTDDIDGDGVINSFDLDTDGDGCYDVIEAGFSDDDNDGILCVSPVIVDSLGVVVACDGVEECSPLNVTDYNIVGSAQFIENDSSYLLTTDQGGGQSGAVWSLETIDLSKDFEVKSKLNLGSIQGSNGADGIAFVLQPLSSDQGSSGGGIGYLGIKPSVAVEFDTYKWNTNDPDGDHAAVVYDGETTNHNNEYIFSSEIADGDYHEVIFSWNSSDNSLTVSWDGIVIISAKRDIINEIFSGNPEVYYGFTAATGGSVNNQSVIITGTCSSSGTGQPIENGYTDPLDLDDNGTKDYKELSDNPIIISNPDSVEVPIDNSVFFTVNASVTGTLFYQWQINMGGGWINLSENSTYTGVNTDSLIIENVTLLMDGTIYRVVVSNITLSCSEDVYSNNALLSVLPDNDRDNIPDIIDLDDDNDGILDTYEGIFDQDGDGIPNHFDLDADGDGCDDVIESGFSDEDDDGILGVNPITVDSLGLVTSSPDGYTDPLDRDANDVDDFMELGSSVVIKTNPSSVSIIETRNARYEVEVIAEGTVLYQWQSSADSGATWLNIADDIIYSGSNTSVLTLTNAPIEFNDYQFRVNISTPAFVCDTDIFSSVALTVLPDNDRDGIADEDDLDDDNDGILDIYEGNSDIDGDGIINSFDLDSDGDGCFDVSEIGCDDPDGDGIVGVSPVKVDGLGLVIDNYILKLDFNENFDDSSENNLTVIDNGVSLTNDRFGIPSNASFFDGIDDFISVDHDSLMDLGRYESFSVSMWIKLSNTLNPGESSSFIQKQSSDSSWNYEYTTDTSNYLNFEINPQNIKISKEINPFNIGQWYHIVLQKRGNNYTHYIDGDTIFSVVDSTIIGDNLEKIFIGGSPILKNWYKGIIDDIVISGDFGSCNYSIPYDNDSNGVYDFLDFGGGVLIDTFSGDKEITENTNTFFSISSVSHSEIIFQWQFSEDGGVSWISIEDTTFFDGFRSDSLIIKNSPLYFSNYMFRVLVSTPSYQCGTSLVSDSMILKVLPDNDLDGISDIEDLDDDNDGIYDTYEGSGDIDGDGIINQYDLDSDGDGCFDAIEAGFTDHNNDGILGDSVVLVDEKGLVTTGIDGYTQPVDRDSNFIPDYLDFGSQARIIVEPYDIFIVERSDSSVSVIADVSEGKTKLFYLWQVSENGGMTWEGLANTSNIFDIINADISYSDRIFRVIVSTPSYMCGSDVISDPFRIIVTNDFDIDLVGNFEDVDDDNDGIYDSIECFSNGSLILSGDIDSVYTSSYPLMASFSEKSGFGGENDLFRHDIDVSMSLGTGDIYEGCYIESDISFDDGIFVEVDGKTILYFNQYHWDVLIGKADPEITREFNQGGIFAKDQKKWYPWSENFDIKLVIRDGSIKLLSRISTGEMVDVIPYMDNKVDGWILDKNFNISCKDGFNIVIGNTNHAGPSKFDYSTNIIAYVCNDVDDDGNLNNKDLDSDDDDCYDVSEAGFNDTDNDGILSKSPLKIDSLGRVLEDSGYLYPLDNDNNGILDFLEKGFEIDIISQPVNYILVKEGDTLSLTVDVELAERFNYQWQVRDEFTLFWKDLEDTIVDGSYYQGSKTNKLNIISAEFDQNQIENIHMFYRLIISSPAYLCEDDIITEAFEIEFYHKDLHIPNGFSPNNDGINDIWIIRGIEAYPKNKVRVYNRWNNRVYEKKGYSNDWDGTNQMQLYFGDGRLPEGTYFYIFDLGDGSKPLTGFVFIKRE